MTNEEKIFNVAILVLGDLNRSPRMLNHCVALSESFPNIQEISLIGYDSTDIRKDISSNTKIKRYNISNRINKIFQHFPRIFFIFTSFFKILFQIFSMFFILFKIPKFSFLILQNPPGIPSMFVCWLVCKLRKSKFIIDWHNYGYTILKVNKRPNFIVKIAEKYEKFFGKKSDMNLCVSQAEKRDLKKNFGIDAICLPDKPLLGLFKFLSSEQAPELYKKYKELNELLDKNRPILMISSTSWTPDEDFNILLNSFIKTEEMIKNEHKLNNIKKVLFLITGKGPMKENFMKKVEKSNLNIFNVKSIWLDSDDYPKLLALCDLGICLHYSSSGIDLPMKVVDMFSACLPAAAIYYPTIEELVKNEENGFTFRNERELSKILKNAIEEISERGKWEKIEKFRKRLKKDLNEENWVAQWKNRVKKAIIDKKFI
jgi:beta-1,4-mannosyltransferase